MKQLFLEAYENYVNHIRTIVPDYDSHSGHGDRRRQCHTLIDCLNDNFNFDKIVVLETGASSSYNDGLFGLFLGYVAQKTNGKMISVDISEEIVNTSKKIFNEVIPELDYSANIGDSISFLKNIEEIPNLVHLDSWDLNLSDILPCALHGWEEFRAIETKMPKGSIIVIDDNYPKDTNLQWVYTDGRVEKTTVRYPMIGKGAHVYQHVLNNSTNWELIGTHYNSPNNIKIIIQKIKENKNNIMYNHRDDLIQDLNNLIPSGKGVEIGVFKGEFSKHILKNWGGTLYMVDVWRPLGDEYEDDSNHKNHLDAYQKTMENIKGFEDRGIMVRATSEVAANMFQDESLDYIFIDANHAYDFIVEDINLWFPKLKKGGMFSGHDYINMDWYNDPNFAPNGKDKSIYSSMLDGTPIYNGVFGVNPAVDEFCNKHGYKPNVTKEWFGTWWFIK